MRYSKMFGATVKSVPADLKTTSHKLLYQAGFIRQVAAGRYAFLPLGYRVWQKIMDIIEEEMEELGSQRLLTPNLHPIEIWKQTNRDTAFGEEMYVVEDHHGAEFALGATAEGLMVELVKQFKPSYKNLPIYIHQFSSKFRDEKRPKGGLLRVREFTMKDAYSFDATEEDLLKTYKKFYEAYIKIAKRFDLEVVPVLADSGAIGGDYNHEFIVKSDAGEGEAFRCDKCSYAAHIDKASAGFKKLPQDKKLKPVKEYVDSQAVTCAVLAKNMGIRIEETTKTILFRSGAKFIAAMVRGDYDINEAKLKRQLNLDSLSLATEAEVKKLTGADVGFAGPIGLPKGTLIIADETCEGRTNFEAGANKTGVHLYNLNFKRDLPEPVFADIRAVKEGDSCLQCKTGKLRKFVGIEWGHCFKQDLFYTRPHEGKFIDQKGERKYMWMGAYGIGLGRTMATIVETHHDEKGIVWPKAVAPFAVHLISLEGTEKQTKKVHEALIGAKIGVLWDDRDESAGTKFADADLIGIPVRLVVSEKTLRQSSGQETLRQSSGQAGNKVEWKKRDQQKSELISVEEVIKRLT